MSDVGYAVSTDGTNWTNPYSYPILTHGEPGSWDAIAISPGAIIKEESGYKMYYVGWSYPYDHWHIGLAVSEDGINWEKYPEPVLYGTTDWEYRIAPSSVIKIDSIYYLYYFGNGTGNTKIGVATSFNGINWTRFTGNPILEATQTWEGYGIYEPSVILDEGIYKMIYVNQSSNAFGMATSTDGINWTKNNANPFFTKDQTANNWADEEIAYPFFTKIENEYRIYYSGIGTPGSIIYSLGFMRKFVN